MLYLGIYFAKLTELNACTIYLSKPEKATVGTTSILFLTFAVAMIGSASLASADETPANCVVLKGGTYSPGLSLTTLII